MNSKLKTNKTYRYTILAMRFLEKILGSKITVEGLENIPNQPVLFVANHFTRSETFIVPYVIYKNTNRQIRCLADEGLFYGILGKFLKSIGAVSTKDKQRDQEIISDLIVGRYDWMIFPEGSMIKNKEIHNDGKKEYLVNNSENENSPIRTGSAVLALKSELYRKDIIECKAEGQESIFRNYQKDFLIEFDSKLEDINTYIVPVNITYYPIRPGQNFIQKFANKIFKKLPSKIAEELEIEGNLLLSANINISFCSAINLGDYIKNVRKRVYQIPLIKNETKVNLILRYFRHRLTNQFMGNIYANAQINIDHIVVAIWKFYPQNEINIKHFLNLVYLSLNHIINLKDYRVYNQENIFELICGDKIKELTSLIQIAKNLKIIEESSDGKAYLINKKKLEEKNGFNQARIENIPKVILNEFLLLENAVEIVKNNVLLSENEVVTKSFDYITSKDLENFENDYKLYYDKDFSKNKIVGMPVFLDNETSNNKKNQNNGILLIHGYLSAPKEMEEMAKYFNNLGFKTYSVRLKGHGTSPINLEKVKWQDWYESLNYGYAALKLICSKVFVIGFSTGGLLALISALKKENKIDAIVCINPAFKLQDIRSKFVHSFDIWNDLLEKFKIKRGQLRYVDWSPENPDINYIRNYIKGVEQLELLMDFCKINLAKITCPILLMQSKNDPTVDPTNAEDNFNKLASNIKILEQLDNSKHVIVKGQGSDKIFAKIDNFIRKFC